MQLTILRIPSSVDSLLKQLLFYFNELWWLVEEGVGEPTCNSTSPGKTGLFSLFSYPFDLTLWLFEIAHKL